MVNEFHIYLPVSIAAKRESILTCEWGTAGLVIWDLNCVFSLGVCTFSSLFPSYVLWDIVNITRVVDAFTDINHRTEGPSVGLEVGEGVMCCVRSKTKPWGRIRDS